MVPYNQYRQYSFQKRTFTQNTALLISSLKAVNSPKHRELITIGNIAGRLLFRRNTSRARYNFVMTILVFRAAFRRVLFPFISADAISPHTAYISLIDARPKPLELSREYIRISLRVTLELFPSLAFITCASCHRGQRCITKNCRIL